MPATASEGLHPTRLEGSTQLKVGKGKGKGLAPRGFASYGTQVSATGSGAYNTKNRLVCSSYLRLNWFQSKTTFPEQESESVI